MSTEQEVIRAGIPPIDREKLECWLNSPEGRRVVSAAAKEIQTCIAEMRRAGEIPLNLIHTSKNS